MKFFPTYSNSVDTSIVGANEFFGRVLRFVRDSGAGVVLVRFTGGVGVIRVLLDTEKPMYFLIPEGSAYKSYQFQNLSGSCLVNVSGSPYFGDDPEFIKLPQNTGINSGSLSPSSADIKSGNVRIFRAKNSERLFVAFNSIADANSMEVVKDETFFVPNGTNLSAYAASTTNLSWGNV